MPDPLFAHGLTSRGGHRRCQGPRRVRGAPRLGDVGHLVRAQGHLRHAEPDRTEPRRPYGILQTLADGIKLFFKEDLLPDQADRFVFKLAPYLALLPALLIFTIVPVGGVVTIAHHTVELQVADPAVGILFLLALSSCRSTRRCSRAGPPAPSTHSRIDPRVSADDLLRSRHGSDNRHGRHRHALVVDADDRGLPGSELLSLEHLPPRNTALPLFAVAVTAELNRPPFDLTEGSRSSWAGSTPSTRRCVSRCSTWPSS